MTQNSLERRLWDAKTGEQLTFIRSDSPLLSLKLMEMGLFPAAKFRLLKRAPLAGPLLLELADNLQQLAIGPAEAKEIWIQ